jgi:single-strand DNA-binding protein
MSGFVNKVILVGNLGRDPEVREFPDGAKQAKVSLATSESYKNKNGDQVEHTEWHSLVFRRRLAEIAQLYLKKGHKVYVEGRIKTRAWEQEGQKRQTTEIEVDQLTMLESKKTESSSPGADHTGGTSEPDFPFF